ncbi:DUF397 domain-containing protein [Streptosporangium saharense]|uniref:DUF397 domain-containing protein n=1 Tax=Streptosporangium saharense TaxID=1706840 RepID=A0A7W7QTB0_9ACTN|nr:DUF397 domain-containing protein [Streptosporangium saharense]MBB4919174.1 hypothetical protein [Streptosporangium saharense]
MELSDARWIKSSLSGDNGGNCVEVTELNGVGHADLVAVRDSKDPEGPKLFFTPAEWNAFLNGVKAGRFSRSLGG